MAAVQFVIGVAFSMVPPVLPLYLPHLGLTSPDSVRRWAGMVVGITPLAAALTAPLWGRLLTRIDRRLIVLISCVTAAGFMAAMSLARSAPQLLLLRFCMGLFGGHIAACMAIVAAVSPAHRLGLVLGTLTTAQLSGSLLGPLLGGLAADSLRDLRAPFYTGSIAALFVCPALLAVRNLPTSRSTGGSRTVPGAPAVPLSFQSLLMPATVLLLVQAAIMGPQPVVSLQVAQLLGTPNPSATLAGLAFSVVGLSGLLAAPVLGAAGDKLGRFRLLLLCLTIGAVITASQAAAGSYGTFVLARFLGGLCLTAVVPLVNAAAAHGKPAADHGRIFGLTSSAAYLGAFFGPLTTGQLAAVLGLGSAFVASGVWLLLAAWTVRRWQILNLRMDPAQQGHQL